DGAIKPDITGPGVDIVAANSKDGFLGEPGEPYTTLSGTSMSAPHVTGAAAILAQVHPDWAPDQLKATLMAAAKPHPKLGAFAQGAGRVDVARAIKQTVSTSPASASLGRQEWPHGDDKPVNRTITYRNTGSSAVTLKLAVQTLGPKGKPAPAKMFGLSASTLTVPAGGQASVTLTADTRVSSPDGFYTGRITATGGDTVVTTPFAVDKEVESYNLTLKHTNRAGELTGEFFSGLFRTDGSGFYEIFDEDGAVTVRVPKGRYALLSFVGEGSEEEPVSTLLANPKVDLTANRTVAVDARKGRPVSVSVPHADAAPLLSEISADVITPDFPVSFSLLGQTFEGLFSGHLGPAGTVKGFVSRVAQTRAKVTGEGDPTNSPFVYNLAWFTEGRMVTGLTKNVKPADLATVKASYARQGVADGSKVAFSVLPGKAGGSWGVSIPFQVPFERTEYYTAAGGVRWESFYDEIVPAEPFPEFVATLVGPQKAYKAGKTYTERWNHAVFGTTVANPTFPEEWVTRWQDTLFVLPALYSDGEGRPGFSTFESAKLTVFRNGTKIAELEEPFAFVEDLPKGTGTFRVEIQANRGKPHVLSTEVRTAWTFKSGHVSGDLPKRLPVSSVRFTAPVDANNTAPAGKTITIPVTVDRQAGSAAKPVKTLSVEVSFDDGKTWQKVKLTPQGSAWKMQIAHPDQAGFVSLRATSTDTAGNKVEQTVIRAYQISK
ncbi:MAG TPA: S8 family serine peptidase, partial [Pilimelia sp.]|nr:S8 family serine peptidase [Pilimelia sp.]